MWLNRENRESPEEIAAILLGIAALPLGDPIVLS